MPDGKHPSAATLTTKIAGELHAALHDLQRSSCTSERRCPLLDKAWEFIEEATERGEQLRRNAPSQEVTDA